MQQLRTTPTPQVFCTLIILSPVSKEYNMGIFKSMTDNRIYANMNGVWWRITQDEADEGDEILIQAHAHFGYYLRKVTPQETLEELGILTTNY